MSSSNNTPRLTDSAWLKKKGWESMHHFMLSYELKTHNLDDYKEGKSILAAFRKADDEEKAAASGGQSGNVQNSYQQAQTNGAMGRGAGGHMCGDGALEGNKPFDSANIRKEERAGDKKPVAFMGTLQSYPSYGNGGSAKD
ncbi:hypothetical protein OCU04_003414 [Sclerotinia nivalis]|uniref:Uncharacterized protein n=1 Tax=Sclerotinia nivalis TaxID=352851 RepID=A0A9X0DP97_9HELO|nr:hypothetical protein OCU04_003414 [Sclerotinia nivalis]